MRMLHEESVIQAILKVVTHHECAVIADFGGFIVRRNPGLFNSFSGELKASTAMVYFNNEIKSDDGFVADALRSITGESFKSCQEIISNWVKHVNSELALKRNYSLMPLGNFHTNSSGGVFFVSSPNFSVDPYSFGLPVFQWKWDLFNEEIPVPSQQEKSVEESLVPEQYLTSEPKSTSIADSAEVLVSVEHTELLVKEKTIEEEVKSTASNPEYLGINLNEEPVENDSIDSPEITENNKPSLLWQIAAAIAIVSISISLYFTFSQLLQKRKEKTTESAAMMLASTNEVSEEEIVFVKEDRPISKKLELRFTVGENGMDSMKLHLKQFKGKFFVTGGAYITEALAFREGIRWQNLGYDVCLLKAKNSSLTKVVLGRFNSEKMASLFVENIDEMPAGTISVEELTFNW